MLRALIEPLIVWYKVALVKGGYPLVVLLMAIESSVLPVPSEAIIPPAAHMAYNTHQISLSLWGIVLMYWTARLAGRPLVLRYGRYAFISREKLEGAERWTAHYGSMGIFISRLLPVVRHLIGIPAGIVRMNYATFSLYTLLGSGVWCGILCYIGIKMGQDEKLMNGEVSQVSLWLGGILLVLGGLYFFFVHRHMKAVGEGRP
jgi:membrane protein DedA with SNARE-associated domain